MFESSLSFSVGWTQVIQGDVGIKIFNGTFAIPGQFPYMAAIRVSKLLLSKTFHVFTQLLLNVNGARNSAQYILEILKE